MPRYAPGRPGRPPAPRGAPHCAVRFAAAVVLTGLALAGAGCAPAAESPTPTWTFPTVTLTAPPNTRTATPTRTPTPTPTPTPTYDQALYDQAVAVRQTFWMESTLLYAAGGVDTLPPEMAAVLTGEAYTAVATYYAFALREGYHWEGSPQFSTTSIAPLYGATPDGTIVAIQTCEEIANAYLFDNQGNMVGDSDYSLDWVRYYFSQDPQRGLVIFDLQDRLVQSCPF